MTAPQLAIYERILTVVKAIGPFKEDPKKTSIHLTRTSAFAGVSASPDLDWLRSCVNYLVQRDV